MSSSYEGRDILFRVETFAVVHHQSFSIQVTGNDTSAPAGAMCEIFCFYVGSSGIFVFILSAKKGLFLFFLSFQETVAK